MLPNKRISSGRRRNGPLLFLIVWLSIWLLLSIARQCFDLVGKLWALVLIDLAQVLAICSALFPLLRTHHHNNIGCCHSIFLALFPLVSLCLNVALFLWWCTDLLVEDGQKERLLAFGLPFGHSFFLRHSPFCLAQFNLTSHRWEQSGDDCPFPFSYFEGVQSIGHAIFAVGTFLAAMALAIGARKGQPLQQLPLMNGAGEAKRIVDERILAIAGDGTIDHHQQQEHHYNLVGNSRHSSLQNEGSQAEENSRQQQIYVGGGGQRQRLFTTVTSPSSTVDGWRRPPLPQHPIPPIRRSFPRRKEQRGGGANNESGRRRMGEMAKEKQQPQQLVGGPHDNYSSMSTVPECGGPGGFLAMMAAANSLSSRSSSSSSPAQNRCLLLHQRQSPNYTRPTGGEGQREEEEADGNRNHGHRRSTRGGGGPVPSPLVSVSEQRATTSLVSFDPKARGGQLIQVRQHRRASSSEEEEETAEGKDRVVVDDWTERKGEEMGKKEMPGPCRHFSSDSIPSTDAPIPLLYSTLYAPPPSMAQSPPSSSIVTDAPLPPSILTRPPAFPPPLLRQRVPPQVVGGIGQLAPVANTNHPSSSPPSSGAIPPSAAYASFYDTFLSSAPQDACTSFPAQQGALPRPSAVQLAAISAIRLSRPDLTREEEVGGWRRAEEAINGDGDGERRHRAAGSAMGMLV